MTILWLIAILAGIWLLAYHRSPVRVWLPSIAAGFGMLSLLGLVSGAAAIVLWGLFLGLALPFVFPALRRRWISQPVLGKFRKVLPPMSKTEQDALQAGTVWWEGELFSGRPDWNKLLLSPPAVLSEEEKAFLAGPTNELCQLLDDWRITHHDQDLAPEAWATIKNRGFFGLIIPKRYGGLGFSAMAHSTVVMKLASRSITAAVTVMVPNSLGPAKLLLHYGTPEQKDYYLPRLAAGTEIPCFALTGPEAGSDAGSMPDRGVVCRGDREGKEILGIRLNWEKRYITLGPIATLLGLAFKLYDPDHLLGDREELGITLALIPTDTPGIEIGDRHIPLNIPFQNGPNRGKDVFIPLDWVIGGQERAGHGWRMLMECLAEGRSISLPALSTGAGKTAARFSGAYARIRRQFHQPIGYFEGIEEALARIAGKTYQMDAVRHVTLGALDAGQSPSLASAIAKYHLTERYRAVLNDAMDIHGGSGICLGPRNLIGRAYQSIPIAITVEGANILTRNMIIFGQGAIRCHPYLLEEMEAAADTDVERGLVRFDAALLGHLGHIISIKARAAFLGLTRAGFVATPVKGPLRRYYQHLTWMSAAFALVADAALLSLGGTLKRRERLSARLGDILSQLYLSSAVLKHFEDQGRAAEDLPLAEWACQESLQEIQRGFRELLHNLPNRPVAWALHWIAFPTGLPYRRPSDRLDRTVARLLLAPSATRDRLTADIYQPDDLQETAARVERAFVSVIAVAPIEKKIQEAKRQGRLPLSTDADVVREALASGVITDEEAEALARAEALRSEVIRVDAFSNADEASPTQDVPSGPRPLTWLNAVRNARTG